MEHKVTQNHPVSGKGIGENVFKRLKAVFPKNKSPTPSPIALIIGNVLDHYDTALYGFAGPLLAHSIFPEQSNSGALIAVYAIMAISLLTRPLGALFFSRYSIRHGNQRGLFLSLTGLAVSTAFIGLLPGFSGKNILVPTLLALARAAQGFFAAGEGAIAPVLLLESVPASMRGRMSSFYNSSSLVGILLASLASFLVVTFSMSWRIPFLFGILTGIVGIWIRKEFLGNSMVPTNNIFSNKTQTQKDYSQHITKTNTPSITSLILQHRAPFARVVVVSGFSYSTYIIPFVFMNIFVPQVTSISLESMLAWNTTFLFLDLCLLPFFGTLSDKFSRKTILIVVSALMACLSPLFFFLMGSNSLCIITLVRITLILLGIAFTAPFYAWATEQFPQKNAKILSGLAYSIGTELFGRTTPFLCLLLWNFTHSTLAPAIYLVPLSIVTMVSLGEPLLVTQKRSPKPPSKKR